MVANPFEARQTPKTGSRSGTQSPHAPLRQQADRAGFSDLKTIALWLERTYIESTCASARVGSVNLRR
jgi:hypothetical protein